ncbi:MAG: iron-sulfur cluster-binding domain-containing protein [Spirochaetales bacterium]|nr:iron-sulfur cluster-binding domain-containing protein [Spirochaetales bacterium]
MKISVKGPARDLAAFFLLGARRRRHFRRATSAPPAAGAMNRLAEKLHPGRLELAVESVRFETPDTRTFRLTRHGGGELPYFRAGQYLSLKPDIAGNRITRPYSITSLPENALDPGFYEITIRKRDGGFFTGHVWETWEAGSRIESSGPLGWFGYEPLRDAKNLVFLAGGCGITPFKPMAADILGSFPDVTILLLYGITDRGSIIFKDDLSAIEEAYPARFRVVYVDSGPAASGCDDRRVFETGFIDRRIIARYVSSPRDATFYVCGPPAMHRLVESEVGSFGLAPGRIRREAAGDTIDVAAEPGYPAEKHGRQYRLTVHSAGGICTIPARAAESVLQSLERAGLAPPSECRSGECGYCRSKLLSGKIYGINNHHGRRMADAGFGYFHPCSSYPLSDLEISVPVDPFVRRT